MILVETDTRYRVTLRSWRYRCGKLAVTTGPFAVPPQCACSRCR